MEKMRMEGSEVNHKLEGHRKVDYELYGSILNCWQHVRKDVVSSEAVVSKRASPRQTIAERNL